MLNKNAVTIIIWSSFVFSSFGATAPFGEKEGGEPIGKNRVPSSVMAIPPQLDPGAEAADALSVVAQALALNRIVMITPPLNDFFADIVDMCADDENKAAIKREFSKLLGGDQAPHEFLFKAEQIMGFLAPEDILQQLTTELKKSGLELAYVIPKIIPHPEGLKFRSPHLKRLAFRYPYFLPNIGGFGRSRPR